MPFSRSFPFWKSQSSTKDTAPPEYPQTDALVAAAAKVTTANGVARGEEKPLLSRKGQNGEDESEDVAGEGAAAAATTTTTTPLEDLDLARDFCFWWSFVVGVIYGIYLETFSDFCYDILDPGSYTEAALISTDATVAYCVGSFLGGTVLSTLSDDIGRLQLYRLAATVDTVTCLLVGYLDFNLAFIVLNFFQGACDASTPVGYALLADCAVGSPPGRAGAGCVQRNTSHPHLHCGQSL